LDDLNKIHSAQERRLQRLAKNIDDLCEELNLTLIIEAAVKKSDTKSNKQQQKSQHQQHKCLTPIRDFDVATFLKNTKRIEKRVNVILKIIIFYYI
jgi:Lhr-like helicase